MPPPDLSQLSTDELLGMLQSDVPGTPGPQQPQQPQRTPLERAGRVAGLGARAITTGLASLPLAFGEGLNQVYNLGARAVGGDQRPSVFEGFNTFLSNAGLPSPENRIERFSTGVTGALAGAGGQMGLAREAATLPGTASSYVRDLLLTQPGRQAVAAGTGATSAITAGELGAGPVGQTIAGVAGGMAPFVPQMVSRPSPEILATRAAAQEGREAGYVLPPTQANEGGLLSRLLTGLSGRTATEQAATNKNQAVTNQLMKKDIGVPETQRVTVDALKEMRAKAGTVYRDVENFGTYQADGPFIQRIRELSSRDQTLAAELPELMNQDVIKLAQQLQQPQFQGATLVEATKALRDKATAAFKSGDSGAGRFYRGASDAIEELIGRNLSKTGDQGLVTRWQNARQLIAKTHTAEAALNDETGNFSARIIASQHDKGLPLSGGSLSVGRFANTFPGAVKDAESAGARQGQVGISPLDFYAGLSGIGLGGMSASQFENPALWGIAALPAIRPMTRYGILSSPVQNMMMPNPIPMKQGDATAMGIVSGLRGQ